jgi:outer membrane translocation and assembly module TamA
MTHAELASEQMGYRVALFTDLGWVGDRLAISSAGHLLSGAGVGFSGFDGLIRLDVARGFYPRKQTRIAFYFGGKF